MNHGTLAGYLVHRALGEPACRPCLDGRADWQRHYRARMYLAGGPMTVDATGTRRRLQALMRIGWSSDALGVQLGVTGSAVRYWAENDRVRRCTAARVADLYDAWWDKPGPSVRTRNRAARAGWALPLMWNDDEIDDPAARPHIGAAWSDAFDEVAVLRAMYGDPVRLRPSERAEATRRLTAAGLSAAQIAERLGCTKRSVVRQRNAGRDVA